MTVREYRKLIQRRKGRAKRKLLGVASSSAARPNGNETRFRRLCLVGAGGEVEYEARHFILTKVHKRRYTPDFRLEVGGQVVWIEVKDAYRLGSEGRAHLAFELAAERYSAAEGAFVWAKWNRSKRAYQCEAWFDGGREIRKAFCKSAADFMGLINISTKECGQ
jgi:hypothetical protein